MICKLNWTRAVLIIWYLLLASKVTFHGINRWIVSKTKIVLAIRILMVFGVLLSFNKLMRMKRVIRRVLRLCGMGSTLCANQRFSRKFRQKWANSPKGYGLVETNLGKRAVRQAVAAGCLSILPTLTKTICAIRTNFGLFQKRKCRTRCIGWRSRSSSKAFISRTI